MELKNNEVANIKEGSITDEFQSVQSAIFTSFANDFTPETQKMTFNAINSTQEKLSDYIGKTIDLRHFISQYVKMEDEKTGEIVDVARCILIDDKGVSYGCISDGIKNSMIQIFAIYGNPSDLPQPLKVKVTEKKSRRGYKFLSLEVK